MRRRLIVTTLGLVTVIAATLTAASVLSYWRSPRHQLRLLVGSVHDQGYRPFTCRLSGFPHAPESELVRSGHSPSRYPSIRFVARKVSARMHRRSDAQSLHVLGIALVLLESQAIEPLKKAAELKPHDPTVWNDLAVAQYAAASGGAASLLADALGSVHRALIERKDFAEARFNEGLIFESLGVNEQAVRAYREYLRLDARSGWAGEARERLRALQHPTTRDEWPRDRSTLDEAALRGNDEAVRRIVARYRLESRSWAETVYLGEWGRYETENDGTSADRRLRISEAIARAVVEVNGDTLLLDTVAAIRAASERGIERLARGHALYLNARKVYHNRDIGTSLSMFEAAERELAGTRSPARRLAAYYRAMAAYDLGRTDEAMSELTELLRNNRPGHRLLRAQLLWAIGNVHERRGHLHEALAAHHESLSIFEGLGEERNVCAMLTSVAGLLATLGRRSEAWELRRSAFARISKLGDVREMQKALDLAARTEAQAERWNIALPLLAGAADAHRDHNPIVYTSTRIWLALAKQRLGYVHAVGGFETAAASMEGLKDAAMRARAQLDLKLAEAVSLPHSEGRRAALILDWYIEQSASAGVAFFLPEAYMQRAMRAIDLGDHNRAEECLRTTLRLLADRESNHVEQRTTYFRTGDEAMRRLVDLMVRRGDVASAFKVLGETRSRPYRSGAVRGAADNFTTVEYLVLPDRLLVFAAFHGNVTVTAIGVDEERLNQAAERFADAIANDLPPPRELSRWLLDAVDAHVRSSRALVIVPDRVLAAVPFAALRAADGRLLIEHCAVALAPANTLVGRPQARADHTLLVGDPAIDEGLFSLPRLPNARREIKALSGRYRNVAVLAGADATRERVLAATSRATLLHFATHAVVIPENAAASYLVLAASSESSGTLSVRDIYRTTFETAPLVILAGCRTGHSGRGAERQTSLATAFLAAGATGVVGTLWDLPDDAASADMMVRFHDELRRGGDPISALRIAQLAMLKSSDPQRQAPSRWSTFQLYVANMAVRVPPN